MYLKPKSPRRKPHIMECSIPNLDQEERVLHPPTDRELPEFPAIKAEDFDATLHALNGPHHNESLPSP